MGEGKYDPEHEIARALVEMDGQTRDRTLRLFQDMLCLDAAKKQVEGPTRTLGVPGSSSQQGLSGTHRDLIRRQEQLESRLHRTDQQLRDVNGLIRLLEE